MTNEPDTAARRVMIVDDDECSLLLATEVVAHFGAEPIPWSDPAAALEAIKLDPVDMIFMDVHMPGMDGLELTQRIRAIEVELGRRRTPIVALTASAMLHEKAVCLAHGMDDVMLKPFEFSEMQAMLCRWARLRT